MEKCKNCILSKTLKLFYAKSKNTEEEHCCGYDGYV